MKTAQLLNYERDRWFGGDGNLAEIAAPSTALRLR